MVVVAAAVVIFVVLAEDRVGMEVWGVGVVKNKCTGGLRRDSRVGKSN